MVCIKTEVQGVYLKRVFLCDGRLDSAETCFDFISQLAVEEEDYLVLTKNPKLAKELLQKEIPVVGIIEKESDSFPEVHYLCLEDFLEQPESTDFLEKVYRRYHNIPWDILETERTRVRETTLEDVNVFYRLYRDKELVRYTEDLYPDPEQERQFIRDYQKYMYDVYGFGIWTVLEKETGEIIGRAGLAMREGFEEVELGFVFGLAWQGKGYAYEVCKAILEYAREELELSKVQAFVMPDNQASVKLCERLGMHLAEACVLKGVCYNRYELIFHLLP